MRYAPPGFRTGKVTGTVVLAALALAVGSCSADRVTAPPTFEAFGEPELAKQKKSPPGLCQTDRSRPEAAQRGIANARAHACAIAAIEIVAGNAQEVVVARTASAQLVARVVDTQGGGVAGVTVAWSVTIGSGQLTEVGTVSDTEGLVRASFTADTIAGAVQVAAALADGGGVAAFDVQVEPDAPYSVQAVSGDQQIFAVNTSSAPFEARVRDRYGNPTPGAEIRWYAKAELADFSAAVPAHWDTTDPAGLVRTTVSVAHAAPRYGTPLYLDVSLTTTSVGPYTTRFRAWAATERGAVVATQSYTTPSEVCTGVVMTPRPQVHSRSRLGAAESGVRITARASTPGAALSGTLSETTYAGTATFDSLIVSGPPGEVITLVYDAQDYAPDSVRHRLVGGATAVRMVPLDPTHDRVPFAQHIFVKRVRVTDASDNGVRCVPVRFQQSTRDTTILTDSEGVASVFFYAISGTLTASSEGLEGSPITFTVEIYDPCPFPYCYSDLGSATRVGDRAVSRTDTSLVERWVAAVRALEGSRRIALPTRGTRSPRGSNGRTG